MVLLLRKVVGLHTKFSASLIVLIVNPSGEQMIVSFPALMVANGLTSTKTESVFLQPSASLKLTKYLVGISGLIKGLAEVRLLIL